MTDPTASFWELARPLLDRDGVTRSTMMGLPCLRRDGAFFAACDHTTGNLLVKLPENDVTTLIADGDAVPFAPAGRRFRPMGSHHRRPRRHVAGPPARSLG